MRGDALVVSGTILLLASATVMSQAVSRAPVVPQLFATGDRCQACHNGLTTPSGVDVSIGVDWRASMMAHSARDPYWQAAVRREVLDHPSAQGAIEHECSRCHMPMAHVTVVASGGRGAVFSNLPATQAAPVPLASDGVSCSVCHQIQQDRLGTAESFTGHFVIDSTTPEDQRAMFGPFSVEPGLQRLMHSASTFQPAESAHVQSSELCATCHTLYTHALDDAGNTIGELPEQVPYLEWRHSEFRETKSCQSCHMPVVPEAVAVSSTLGQPRNDVSRHTFRGANFFMLRVFNRYRDAIGIPTLPQEIERAAADTLAHLQGESASLDIQRAERSGGQLVVELAVGNRGGHKLPTAYPSRRVWLHVVARNARGQTIFESGAVDAAGRIVGNHNDADATMYEPHYAEIARADEVQIYENIMVDRRGAVTTGLLSGVRYVKDNRLLPRGFDKATAGPDIAVRGAAATDADFTAGGDRIRYRIPVSEAGPVTFEAELLYQSIGYRWAQNLRLQPAPETDRFVAYYESMSQATVARLARAQVELP